MKITIPILSTVGDNLLEISFCSSISARSETACCGHIFGPIVIAQIRQRMITGNLAKKKLIGVNSSPVN